MSSEALPKPMGAGPFEIGSAIPANRVRQGMADGRGIKPSEAGRPRGPAEHPLPLDGPDGIAPKGSRAADGGNGSATFGPARLDRGTAEDRTGGLAEQDDAVIRRVLDGDTDAFEALVRRHGARVNGAVARHVPFDQREEVVQDTWVRAFQSLDGFRPGTRFGDWLAGIAVRASYDFWRQHYRRREVPESALGDSHREWIEAAGADQSVEQFQAHVRREEAQEVLEYALAQVSPEDRLVVNLVHLEGLSAQEAANLLGWSVVNVKVRAHRSRRRMRQALENWLGEESR